MTERNPDNSPCLRPADVRAMVRMANALHLAPPDPSARKRLLLEGLCRLIAADGARSEVTLIDPATARQSVLSAVKTGTPDAPGADGKGGADAGADAGVRQGVAPRSLDAYVDLDGMRLVAKLSVYRHPPARRFMPRERAIVEVMHAETAWIYGHDRMCASRAVLALPPREQATLRLLLAGESERQIASELSISPNTVHHYVKSLYRRFGVRSRGELAGLWDHRGKPPVRPTDDATRGQGIGRSRP